MGKFEGVDLGSVSDDDFEDVIDWVTRYGIHIYVAEGNEKELKKIDERLIWTEYDCGTENIFSEPGFNPPPKHEVVYGYWVGTNPWGDDVESYEAFTSNTEWCESCDGDDEDCSACEGEGSIERNIAQMAISYSQDSRNPSKEPESQIYCTECGTVIGVGAKFCAECGTSASKILPTKELLVKCEILNFVATQWRQDFSDFIELEAASFRVAASIFQSPKTLITLVEKANVEALFSTFIQGGGFPSDKAFKSLNEFMLEADGA